MHQLVVRAAMALVLMSVQIAAFSEDMTPEQRREAMGKLSWIDGPTQAPVGAKAKLETPKGVSLLPEKDGGRFLELTGNLPETGQTVLVSDDWWATLSFTDSGYIKDDEKIDADELLKQLKSTDEPSNEQRVKLGMPKLHTDGWSVPPHYDPATKHLEWGLRLHSDNSPNPVINYTVRLLGRTGYESVVLVSGPDKLDKNVAELKSILQSFDFNAGEKYSEFKQGDHVAEYGLGALVVGGTAAAIAKTGLWKPIAAFFVAFWKLIAAGAVALFAGIGKLFKSKNQ
jgi:uncharacterized membrane-anchored protein